MASLLEPLGIDATEGALKWQPVLDFDRDTCYHTAAISPDGSTNKGLEPSADVSECRSENRLWHSNTYARERCNHSWCAYMYGYYSEMDHLDFWGTGMHRHDWEHAIVWTLHDKVTYVSWSAHGDYTTAHHTEVRFEGTHPKLVAHHGSSNTASLRLAKEDDDDIENALGHWFTGHLVSRETMDDGLGHKLMITDWGDAHIDLNDQRFGKALDSAMPWDARNNEGFDPWH
ncbi:hypothetical protein DL769_002592 [Monosporascus sp. CRB-8-3]|nr:hypothetical protein DL769_002592 [Monosporascus sp. CRB-8-3]